MISLRELLDGVSKYADIPADLADAIDLPDRLQAESSLLDAVALPSVPVLLAEIDSGDLHDIVEAMRRDVITGMANDRVRQMLNRTRTAAVERGRRQVAAWGPNAGIESLKPAHKAAVESGDDGRRYSIEGLAGSLRIWSEQDRKLVDAWLPVAYWDNLNDDMRKQIRMTGSRAGISHQPKAAPTYSAIVKSGAVRVLPTLDEIRKVAVEGSKGPRHDPGSRLAGEVNQEAVEQARYFAKAGNFDDRPASERAKAGAK